MVARLWQLFLVLWSSVLFGQFGREFPGIPAFSPEFMQQYGLGDEMPMMESDEPDSGNWYEKLHWWKEAKRVYTIDIHDIMEQVKRTAQDFDEKKNVVFAKLNEAMGSIPVKPDVALGLIAGFLADIKKKRDQLTENLTEEQLKLISEWDEQEKALEGLKNDFEQLQTIQARLQESFDLAAKQVKECENYEERALENFERIEKVLDDKKAHHYYDVVENSLENIRALSQYLIGPLQIYIDNIAGRAEQLVPKVKKAIQDLEAQGILVRVLTEKEKAEAEALAKKREETRLKAEAQKKAAEEWKTKSWWRKLLYYIGAFFSSIATAIKTSIQSLGSLFSSKAKVVKEIKKTALQS